MTSIKQLQAGSGSITSILDGHLELSAELFSGLTEAEAAACLEAAGLPNGPMKGSLSAFVYQADGQNILIDAGGLIDGGKAVFPNAEVKLNGAERTFWLEPSHRAQAPEPFKPFFDLAASILTAYGENGLLIWGDIVHVQVFQLPIPEAAIAFDVDQAQAVATRKTMLDRAATDRLRLAGMHIDHPGIGYVTRQAQGFAFEGA